MLNSTKRLPLKFDNTATSTSQQRLVSYDTASNVDNLTINELIEDPALSKVRYSDNPFSTVPVKHAGKGLRTKHAIKEQPAEEIKLSLGN